MSGARLSLAALILAMAGSARAQTAEDLSRARAHFDLGRGLYALGDYHQAIKEFSAGYQLVPKPGFLLNLAQCYRAVNELEKTLEFLERFLAEAPPNDRDRSSAELMLTTLREQIAKREPAEPAPKSAVAPPAAPMPRALAAAPAQAIVAQPKAPPHGRSKRRLLWIVVPTAVVVAGAVALGVYFGTRSDPCSGVEFCLSARH